MWALLVFYVFFPVFVYNRKWHWVSKPVQKKRKKIPYKPLTKERLEKYNDVDVVIVGGNISGLVCAAALTRAGIRVLVLERKDVPGGSFREEERGGYTFPNMSIPGNLTTSKMLIDWLTESPLWWHRKDEPVIECKYENKTLKIMNSSKQTRDMMKDTFTNEDAQGRFWYHVNKYSKSNKDVFESLKLYHMPQAFREVLQEWLAPDYMYYNKISVEALIADCGFDENSKIPQCFECIQRKDQSAAELLDFFMRTVGGNYLPKNGVNSIIHELCQTIRTKGGYILTEANVENVDPKIGKIKVNGTEYYFSGKIVSAVSLNQTFTLLDREAPFIHEKSNYYRVLVAFKLGAEIEVKDRIINFKGNAYKFFYGKDKDMRTLCIEYETEDETQDEEKNYAASQLALEIGDIDKENIEWINVQFCQCDRMKNDEAKMYRACKPTTKYKNLYITGMDMIHTDSLESAVRSGYITANAVTNYGTFIDILTGNELIRNV